MQATVRRLVRTEYFVVQRDESCDRRFPLGKKRFSARSTFSATTVFTKISDSHQVKSFSSSGTPIHKQWQFGQVPISSFVTTDVATRPLAPLTGRKPSFLASCWRFSPRRRLRHEVIRRREGSSSCRLPPSVVWDISRLFAGFSCGLRKVVLASSHTKALPLTVGVWYMT